MPRLLRVGLLIHVCSSISQVELSISSMLGLGFALLTILLFLTVLLRSLAARVLRQVSCWTSFLVRLGVRRVLIWP